MVDMVTVGWDTGHTQWFWLISRACLTQCLKNKNMNGYARTYVHIHTHIRTHDHHHLVKVGYVRTHNLKCKPLWGTGFS